MANLFIGLSVSSQTVACESGRSADDSGERRDRSSCWAMGTPTG
jgi:hypothetical protein